MCIRDRGLDLSVPAKAGADAVRGLTRDLLSYGYSLEYINSLSAENGQLLLQQEQNAELLSSVIQNQLTAAMFSGLDALGAFSAGADSQEILLGLQSQIAGFMATFGQQLVLLGLGSLALRNLFKDPVANIVAGSALIAAAGAVRADAQKRLSNITGTGSTQNTIVGYRGSAISGAGNSGSAAFPDKVAVEFVDGTGKIVANGLMDLDRRGQNIYLGG